MGVNSVTLVGRAGRDPEVRYFESGSMVANLTIAVNRRNRDSEPDWFNLEIWGKQAQVAADYVKRGSLIGITGSCGKTSLKEMTKNIFQTFTSISASKKNRCDASLSKNIAVRIFLALVTKLSFLKVVSLKEQGTCDSA